MRIALLLDVWRKHMPVDISLLSRVILLGTPGGDPRGRFVVLKGDMRLVRPRHNTREDSMWKTPDYFAGKTVLVVGAASGTALIFARERAKSDSRAGPISGLGTPLATSPRMREGVKKKSNR